MTTWSDLFARSLRDPADAAETVLAVPVERAHLYMGVLLCACIGTLLNWSFVTYLLPAFVPDLPDGAIQPAPPMVNVLISAGGLILFANIVTWVGRAMGGQGELHDMLSLVVWQQIVLLALQAAGYLLMAALPLVSTIYLLIVLFIYVRMVVQFIRVGHRLESSGAAFAVLFVAIVGIVLALSVLATLVGTGL